MNESYPSNSPGISALGLALEAKNIGAIEALIQAGARLPERGEPGTRNHMTLAYAALTYININHLQPNEAAVVMQQVGIDNLDSSSSPANKIPLLLQAISEDLTKVVKVLLHGGANPDMIMVVSEEESGPIVAKITPLMRAVSKGNIEVVRSLLEYRAKIDSINPDGNKTALIMALEQGHFEIADLLLERGARITPQHPTAFVLATFRTASDFEAALDQIILEGVSINALTEEGYSSLMIATKARQIELGRALLRAGAEVNLESPDNHTALLGAIYSGDTQLISLLLDRRANIEKVTKEALEKAVKINDKFSEVMDRVFSYAITRPDPQFFNQLWHIKAYNFTSDEMLIGISATLKEKKNDEKTRKLLAQHRIDSHESWEKISKLRDLKSAFEKQLKKQNDPNAKRLAVMTTIAFATDTEVRKSALWIRDANLETKLPPVASSVVAEKFITESLRAFLNEAQIQALITVLSDIIRGRLCKGVAAEDRKTAEEALEEKATLSDAPAEENLPMESSMITEEENKKEPSLADSKPKVPATIVTPAEVRPLDESRDEVSYISPGRGCYIQ